LPPGGAPAPGGPGGGGGAQARGWFVVPPPPPPPRPHPHGLVCPQEEGCIISQGVHGCVWPTMAPTEHTPAAPVQVQSMQLGWLQPAVIKGLVIHEGAPGEGRARPQPLLLPPGEGARTAQHTWMPAAPTPRVSQAAAGGWWTLRRCAPPRRRWRSSCSAAPSPSPSAGPCWMAPCGTTGRSCAWPGDAAGTPQQRPASTAVRPAT